MESTRYLQAQGQWKGFLLFLSVKTQRRLPENSHHLQNLIKILMAKIQVVTIKIKLHFIHGILKSF